MYWQRSYIERDLSLGANSGTKTIDLPKSAALSELLLRVSATNGSDANLDNHIFDKITKIEVIVNGSEVVKSLTGKELQAIHYFNTRQVPHDFAKEDANALQWMDFPIQFGRYPGDLEYGLDCRKVTNPQLKITYDFTGAGLSSTSLFSTSTYPVVDLNALQVIDYPSPFPKGYIKSHEITTWNPTTNSEVKRIELPTGNKFRRLIVRNFSTDWWPEQSLAYTYLDLNVGAKQPFKMDTEEWVEMNRQIFGEVTLRRQMRLDPSVNHRDSLLGQTFGISGLPMKELTSLDIPGGSGQHWVLRVVDITTAANITTVEQAYITFVGMCYHNMLCLPFDWPDDSFMLDSKEWSDVDLVLEAASSGIATILPNLAVVLEEVIVK